MLFMSRPRVPFRYFARIAASLSSRASDFSATESVSCSPKTSPPAASYRRRRVSHLVRQLMSYVGVSRWVSLGIT